MYPANRTHISLVISPLRSLMKNQVSRLISRGIKAAAILGKDDMSKKTIDGKHIFE